MRRLANCRRWINRDDGEYYQIGNRSIGILEASGHLLIILSIAFWQLDSKTGDGASLAIACIIAGPLLVFIASRQSSGAGT